MSLVGDHACFWMVSTQRLLIARQYVLIQLFRIFQLALFKKEKTEIFDRAWGIWAI
jgi:hypothetical protein